jgi:hypothetical protein
MAFPKSNVVVSGPISTSADTDLFPTHVAVRGHGGLHHAATQAEMFAITTERRAWGMECNITHEVGFVGKYKLCNLASGGVDDDLTNDNNWILQGEISIGNLYVYGLSGKDEAGYGSPSKPFKTIAYALSQATVGSEIIVYAATYSIEAHITHRGVITCYPGTILDVALPSDNDYLLDSTQLFDTGLMTSLKAKDCTINLYQGRLLKNYNNTNFMEVQANVLVHFNARAIVDIGNKSFNRFFNCSFQNANNTGAIDLFVKKGTETVDLANLDGAQFYFESCNFSRYAPNFYNDTFNGSSGFKKVIFGGGYNSAYKNYHVKFGANYYQVQNNSGAIQRYVYFDECKFDLLSLDPNGDKQCIKLITASFIANVIFSMSATKFSRAYKTLNPPRIFYSIYADTGVTATIKTTIPSYSAGAVIGGPGTVNFGAINTLYVDPEPIPNMDV